jgi:hypothetical protein
MILIIKYDANESQETSKPTFNLSTKAATGMLLATEHPVGPSTHCR